MKKRKNIIVIIISVLVIISACVALFMLLNKANKLSVQERRWINNNVNTVQNINVINNTNVFTKNGSGVFYTFLNDFSKEYSLTINPITYNSGSAMKDISLGIKYKLDNNDHVFYVDHYVLVGSSKEYINNNTLLDNKKIGVLKSDYTNIEIYINNGGTITQYDTIDQMLLAKGDGTIDYFIVPLIQYLDTILANDYYVLYHYSDASIYYVLETDDSTLGSILVKYLNRWNKELKKNFDSELFKVFVTALKIPEATVDAMQSVEYNYGFVNASPYEVISGGKYGGIVAVILSDFSSFASIDFNFTKYNNYDKFNNALNDNKVDIYFNYYNYANKYNKTNGLAVEYTIATKKNDYSVIKSLNSLTNKTVYVDNNSVLHDLIKNINGINVITYDGVKDLDKINKLKEDVYLVIDKWAFKYYKNNKLNNWTDRYSDYLNNEYSFMVKEDGALYKLLNKYMNIIDSESVLYKGLYNHDETIKNGTIIGRIAEYIIYAVIAIAIIALIILRRGKKIVIAKKIKKDDKMKFIDQLTSLKNRNFLAENIEMWNNNTIYPQTIIVVDLNKIQEINDIHGYNEGDKQIKAMANVLIKNQLDNSEIMRTDGNEFVIYLVGYSARQVSNYIHKLNKEIDKLPFEFGAEFGQSVIEDNIKTVEDALNEAVEDMKSRKETKQDDKESKK